MKRLVSVILITISAAFLFGGCSNNPEEPASIVGIWYCEWSDENKDLIKTTVAIEDNGRMTISYDSKSGNTTGSEDFLWEAEDGIFWYGCDEEELDLMQPEGMKYKVYDDYLTLFYDDESSFKFEKK